MTSDDPWQDLGRWSKKVLRDTDLEGQERDYKLTVAHRLDQARIRLLSGDDGSVSEVQRALSSSNLLGRYFLIDLGNKVRDAPELMANAFRAVWIRDPRVGSLNTLGEVLRGAPHDKVSTGNLAALGSLLLMARKPTAFPPFRPNAVKSFLRVVGITAPKSNAPPAERYQALLDFLDEFIERGRAEGLEIQDRLDAQGLAWTVTQEPPPEDWPPEQQQALIEWRESDPTKPASPPADVSQRAWLVRPKPGGPKLVGDWRNAGYVSVAANHMGRPESGISLAAVREVVDSGYQHIDYSARMELANEYHKFISVMSPGDIVATVADDTVRVGVVSGDLVYSDFHHAKLRRPVGWLDIALNPRELPAPLPSLLDLQGSVVDLTEGLPQLLGLIGSLEDAPPEDRTAEEILFVPAVPALPGATDALAQHLHIPRVDLQDMLDVLQDRQQLVFYGPPGTGKSYIAQALAEHIVGTDDPSRAQLVQFHPAYSYEDFFEGFRPVATLSGHPGFDIRPGPLRRIASAAVDPENAGAPFVLIIDEMNRANLAKVFGELYFLLEYRNKFVQLQYNPGKPFRLPANLFIIGTMNTADRSIAMVDAAIRRRFPFIELHPDVPPIRDVLPTYLERNHKSDHRARLLAALNAAIEDADRDMRIGPSYLMRSAAESESGLQRIWRYDILPLLEEHYYGRLTPAQVRARFGLDALQSQIGAEQVPDEPVEDIETSSTDG